MDNRTQVLADAIAYAYERHAAGDLVSAETVYYKVLEAAPQNPDALQGLGIITCQRGDYASGAEILKAAALAAPENADIHCNLGNTLRILGRNDQAKVSLHRALQINPHMGVAWSNLSATQRESGETGEALSSARRARDMEPSLSEAWLNEGCALQSLGRMDEALAAFEGALQLDPNHMGIWDSLLLGLQYSDHHTAEQLFSRAKDYGIRFPDLPRLAKRETLRRIGFVSGDLRHHPVGQFLLAMLRSWKAEYGEVFLYSNSDHEDSISAQLKACPVTWRSILLRSDQEAHETILRDDIDLLVDLSGHTAHNRLPLFAIRSAPVQAAWLGYSATTGVSQIDWMIGDRWVTPVEQEPFFTERVARLPHSFLCFQAPEEEKPLPARPSDKVVYGSFNNPSKISDSTLKLWARVLEKVPEAKLVLKYRLLDDPSCRDALLARAERCGLPGDRLEIHAHVPRETHLEMLASLTCALDTFPYTGATTTVEALWQGVPVVTLTGDRYVSRMSASVLSAVGLEEWIAGTEDDFVRIAVALASPQEKSGEALRQMVKNSDLTDGDQFASDFWALAQRIYAETK